MVWARTPDPEIASGTVKISDPTKVLKVGDIILVRLIEIEQEANAGSWVLALEQEPDAQGALLSMENGTGHVKAMVGGLDYQYQPIQSCYPVSTPTGFFIQTVYLCCSTG